MNRTLMVRLCLIGLFLLAAKLGWDGVKNDDGMMLLYFIVLGMLVGLAVVKYLLPWFGDAVGTFVFSSSEEISSEERLKAAAQMSQGDDEGTVSEDGKNIPQSPKQEV